MFAISNSMSVLVRRGRRRRQRRRTRLLLLQLTPQKVLLRPRGRRPLRLLGLPLALPLRPHDVRLHPRAQLAAEHGGAPHWRRAPVDDNGPETRVLRPCEGSSALLMRGWSCGRDRCGDGRIPTTVISRRSLGRLERWLNLLEFSGLMVWFCLDVLAFVFWRVCAWLWLSVRLRGV